jgi:hypothetical protein
LHSLFCWHVLTSWCWVLHSLQRRDVLCSGWCGKLHGLCCGNVLCLWCSIMHCMPCRLGWKWCMYALCPWHSRGSGVVLLYSLLGGHFFSRRLWCCRLHGVQPRDLLRCSRVIMYTVQCRPVLGLRMGLLHCLPSRVFLSAWCRILLPLCCWDLRRGPGF